MPLTLMNGLSDGRLATAKLRRLPAEPDYSDATLGCNMRELSYSSVPAPKLPRTAKTIAKSAMGMAKLVKSGKTHALCTVGPGKKKRAMTRPAAASHGHSSDTAAAPSRNRGNRVAAHRR